MKVAEPRTPEAVVRAQSIAARLPSLLPSVARAARIGHDRRLGPWLQAAAGATGAVFPARPATDRLAMALHCAHGGLELALDPAGWPALRLALGIEDAALSRTVVEALLAPLFAQLASWLPGLEVRALRRYPAATICSAALPSIAVGGTTLTLVRVDNPLGAHLEARLRECAVVGIGRFAALQVPVRLRVLERFFTPARLGSLSAGDVVLCGAASQRSAHRRCTLLFGLGIAMQADADIEPGSQRAQLAHAPTMIDEDEPAGAPTAGGDGLEHLQVPVAFEIDSARVSLAELASLDAGSVIELDMPLLDALVRLVCQGQTVGVGQLVAIGDQLGVRITRMGLQRADGGRIGS
jgi:type III secretion protein Q